MSVFRGRYWIWTIVVLTVSGVNCFAQVDSDGDGFTDAEELYLGTNPNDASSYPGCVTNSFGGATNLIYVAQNGSDSNPGTSSQPFRTIQKAMTVAQANSALSIGSTIIVEPGAYRESVTLMPSGGVLHAPVILQAATNGTATISGGDAWTNGWSLAPGSTNIYQHLWTNDWGLSAVPSGWPTLSNITRRSEIVIVNGNLYTQVESMGAMSNGTYFVDETNQFLNVQHLAGVVASNAFYEVTQRRSLLEVNGYNTGAVMSNLAVRGMDFRCAASLVESGAVRMINCKNVLYENCTFELNNWTGLYIGETSNVTIRSTSADNNGTKGFEQYEVSSTVFDGVQTCFNNWRGALGQFYGWALAGSKLLHIHRGLFRDYLSYSNIERGMWFDTDCGPLLFERCTLNANLISSGGFGLFIEANQGPMLLENCVIARNGGDWGLLANDDESVTVSNCVVYANGDNTGGELGSSWNTSPRIAIDFETGVIHTNQLRNWNITDSVFSGLATTQLEVHLVNNLTNFLSTLTSDNNFWYNSATSNMYEVVSTKYDLNGWRALTGQDTHSSFLSLLVTNPAVQDTYIDLIATTNGYGTATNAICGTLSNGTGTLDVVLMKFDMSGLTNTAREAELQLAVTSVLNNRPVVFNVYRLTTAWDETATASQARSGSGWADGTFSAADYDPQPYGIGGTRSGAGLNTIIDVTALVQDWVSGTSSNYGIAIIAQPVWNQPENDPDFPNWNQFTIATRESSTQTQRPQITSISGGTAGGGCPSITVSPSNLPSGTVSTPYSQAIAASGSSATPYSFTNSSGLLPSGLALTPQGTLSGTPTTAGTSVFTVQAADTNGCTGTNVYSLVVNAGCPTITLSPSTLPTGTVGWVYSEAITASGGTSPYTYTKVSGTLPNGLTLTSAGALSGTATAAGSSTFTVQAMDNDGCSGSNSYTLVIGTTGVCPTITVSPAAFPTGTVGTAYSQTNTASGGVGPYTFTKSSGSLPAGLNLTAAGVLSGTPTAGGSFTFTVQAADTNACTGSIGYTLVVSTGPGPVFLDFNTAASDFTNNFYSNGGAFTWTASAGITNSGGVKVSTTDETAIYKSSRWNLSTNGASMTLSTFIRSTNTGASVQNALGVSTVTNGQFKSAAAGGWLTFYLNTQSGFSQAKIGYQYQNSGTASANVNLGSSFTLLQTNWYKWTVTFSNTNGASGFGTGSVILDNYGAKGTGFVANVFTTNGVGFNNVAQSVFQSATNYPGIRAWSSSGLGAFDNWSVTAP